MLDRHRVVRGRGGKGGITKARRRIEIPALVRLPPGNHRVPVGQRPPVGLREVLENAERAAKVDRDRGFERQIHANSLIRPNSISEMHGHHRRIIGDRRRDGHAIDASGVHDDRPVAVVLPVRVEPKGQRLLRRAGGVDPVQLQQASDGRRLGVELDLQLVCRVSFRDGRRGGVGYHRPSQSCDQEHGNQRQSKRHLSVPRSTSRHGAD